MVAVVGGAQLLVGERLVGRGKPLEPLGKQRPELPQLLAVPGVGMEALALLQIGAADGHDIRVGRDSEELVIRQLVAARLEIAQLPLHVGR